MLRDWLTLGAGAVTVAALALLLCALAFRTTGGTAAAAGAIGVCGGWALWRVRLIFRLLAAGPRLSGRVVVRRDAGHALVAYAFANRVYESTIAVRPVPGCFDPRRGDDVAIVIDPRRPTRAYFLQTLAD